MQTAAQRESNLATSNQRHIVHHPDGGWAVRKPHAERVSSRHDTQAQAQTRAKEILSHGGGGEAVTHGRNGDIRQSDTIQPATVDWSILSPQGRVLFYLALCPDSTTKSIARAIGHTERNIWSIIQSLRERGMLQIRRVGRRHHYTIDLDAPLLHPTIHGLTIRPVLEAISSQEQEGSEGICE